MHPVQVYTENVRLKNECVKSGKTAVGTKCAPRPAEFPLPQSLHSVQANNTVRQKFMSDTPPTLSMKRRIKRIAPLQLGKMLAILYGIMGLIFIPFFLIMSAVASQMPAQQRVGLLALGAGFALFVPVIYAAMGFVIGALGALIYNLVAKWIGGIEVEVE